MATNFLWQAGSANNGLLVSAFNLMTTELKSLATGSAIVSSVNGSSGLFTNSNTAQAVYGEIYFDVGNPGIGTALAAGAVIAGYFLTSPDGGTTFEQTTVVPSRPPDFLIQMPATTITANTVYKANGPVIIPALQFKVLVYNNTGETLGTGATTSPYLKLAPYALQY